MLSVPDKLLINLRILGNVQKNGRIARSYDGIISIEGDTFYQSFKRFLTNDSRRQAIQEITSIMNECSDIMKFITTSKAMSMELAHTDEFFKGCENLNILLKEMRGAKNGIENLKFTYAEDINVVSQLDVVILKFSNIIRDLTYKLSYFQSALNNVNYNSMPDPKSQHEIIIDMTSINEINNTKSSNTDNNVSISKV